MCSTSSTASARIAASVHEVPRKLCVEQATSTGASMSSPLWTRAWPARIARRPPARTGTGCTGYQPRSYVHSPWCVEWMLCPYANDTELRIFAYGRTRASAAESGPGTAPTENRPDRVDSPITLARARSAHQRRSASCGQRDRLWTKP